MSATLAIRLPFLALLLAGLPLALAACDAAADEAPSAAFRVLLTDLPADVDSAIVTVERVYLVPRGAEDDSTAAEGSGHVVLSDSVYALNLLDLQGGLTAVIADTLVEGAATYAQLRVVVGEEARLVMRDGTAYDLRTPSGSTSGIKLNLPEIAVDEAGETVSLLVDFDAEASFVALGPPDAPYGYLFKPVLKVAAVTVNGEEVPEEEIPLSD